jgi:hypothetical protein
VAFDAKGGESRFRGSVDRGFHFLCVLLSCIHVACLISSPIFSDSCACETLLYIMSLNLF